MNQSDVKNEIIAYWNDQACGTTAAKSLKFTREYFEEIEDYRYAVEPEIFSFAQFSRFRDQKVLEVATGSGGPAVFMVKETGCRLVGIDINENGIENAKKIAAENGVDNKTEFILADASKKFPFPDASFDAIVSIDSINHFKNRDKVFLEFKRMLKNGGRLLFTDAVVITGILTSEEIAIRSSLGFFLFVPKGENERLLKEAGFKEIVTTDVTDNIISTSLKWHNAREKRKARLLEFEDEAKFNGVQSFFQVTHILSSEKRLSRFMYTAIKGD